MVVYAWPLLQWDAFVRPCSALAKSFSVGRCRKVGGIMVGMLEVRIDDFLLVFTWG